MLVEAADIADADFTLVGEIREEPFIEALGESIPLPPVALEAYTGTLEPVFPHQNGGQRPGGYARLSEKEYLYQQI